jgi:hypothetical protein
LICYGDTLKLTVFNKNVQTVNFDMLSFFFYSCFIKKEKIHLINILILVTIQMIKHQ